MSPYLDLKSRLRLLFIHCNRRWERLGVPVLHIRRAPYNP